MFTSCCTWSKNVIAKLLDTYQHDQLGSNRNHSKNHGEISDYKKWTYDTKVHHKSGTYFHRSFQRAQNILKEKSISVQKLM